MYTFCHSTGHRCVFSFREWSCCTHNLHISSASDRWWNLILCWYYKSAGRWQTGQWCTVLQEDHNNTSVTTNHMNHKKNMKISVCAWILTLDANWCIYMEQKKLELRGSACISRDRRQYMDMIDHSDSFAETEQLQEDPIKKSGHERCDGDDAMWLEGCSQRKRALSHLLPILQLSVSSIHLLMIKQGGDFLIKL